MGTQQRTSKIVEMEESNSTIRRIQEFITKHSKS